MLVGDSHDAAAELVRDARAERHRRPVRAEGDLVAVADPARMRVGLGDLHLGERSLELQLGNPLDGRAREQRPVADESKAVVVRRLKGSICAFVRPAPS